MKKAWLSEVMVPDRGSQTISAAAKGAATVTVGNPRPFDDADTVDIYGQRYTVTATAAAVNPDNGEAALTLTLAPVLVEALEEDSPVAVVAGGQILTDMFAKVDVGDGESIDVAILFDDRLPWVEGVYDPPVPVFIDDAHTQLVGADGQTPAIPVETATLGDTVPNGTFEDQTTSSLFAEWKISFWSVPGYWTEIAGDEQIAGSRSLGITTTANDQYLRVVTERRWPVQGGQQVSVRCQVKVSRDGTRAAGNRLASLMVWTSDAEHDPGDGAFGAAVWQHADSRVTLNADETVTLEGTVTVPDGHAWLRFALQGANTDDGAGEITVIFDQVERFDAAQEIPVQNLSSASKVDGVPFWDAIAAHFGLTGPTETQTFTVTDSKSYDGSGNTWATPTMFQGYSGPRGQRKSAATIGDYVTWLAGRTATEGYLGLRVDYAPNGADSLLIGWHETAVLPATWAGLTRHESVQTANPAHDGKVVWIPLGAAILAAINAGTLKGFLLGPAPTTADKYVYQVDGATQASPMQLRLVV